MGQIIESNLPTTVSNPFKAECIERISIVAERPWFGKDREFKFRGYVEFENGSTSGRQDFEAESMSELYRAVAEFCNTLS